MTPFHSSSSLTRRRFSRNALGVMASGAACRLAIGDEAIVPKTVAAIDCHTHFYDPSRRQGVRWPGKEDKSLYRTVLPDDLRKIAQPWDVGATIAVEASPLLEDNQWLLDVAEKNPFVVGVVGHLDPAAADFPTHLKRFAANSLFRGIRVNHDDLRKNLNETTYLKHLRLLAELDLELDVNGGPDMPADVARLAAALPDLRMVVNHAANSTIDGKPPPANWRQGMAAAAKAKHVFCKVSGLVDGTHRSNGDAPADVEFYRPLLDGVWAAFGEDRLIYGSNWPVSDRFATYGVVHSIVHTYFAAKGNSASEKFFRHNALAAYKPPR